MLGAFAGRRRRGYAAGRGSSSFNGPVTTTSAVSSSGPFVDPVGRRI
jgi:hypothetical protein